MPDHEMFKAIIQGGSFALIVLLFCWILFRLEPRIREMIEKKDQLQSDTIKSVTENSSAMIKAATENASAMIQKVVLENKMLVEAILSRFAAGTEAMSRECREERKEWMEAFQREGELNRKARHELANRMTEIVASVYTNRDRERSGSEVDNGGG